MVGRVSRRVACLAAACLVALTACRREPVEVQLTATSERASRRAFDGAPPVIPHKPLGAACITCHTSGGKVVPNIGYAPANPHGKMGSLENCRQCHLFKQADDDFAENLFVGVVQTTDSGEAAFPGAPSTIPHPVLMRENCVACHAGPSSRPEIRCTHTERVNCTQCHLPAQTATVFSAEASP